jgi:tRNA threonylcarbamoyladenosine biosynthesis protein TsaB
MGKILCIDTATDICTVALFEGGSCIAFRDSGSERTHAVKLAVFIDEVLKEGGIEVKGLAAVAISMGPGSYTGLRIGVSMAKGLCYGANVPLIAVSTLKAMCFGVSKKFLESENLVDYLFCPMLDARRMEVYNAIFDFEIKELEPISAKIIDDGSYLNYLEKQKIIFFGSGAEKTKLHIKHPNAVFYEDYKHTARNMAIVANQKLAKLEFEDVAYFEPFYLKDFVATTPKKNILLPNNK